MQYLLDTHLLIWWMNNDSRLPVNAATLIANRNLSIAISAANIWEIANKHAMGRLDIPENFMSGLSTYPFEMIDITFAHAWTASHLPPIHKDPFDRLLVAQAQLDKRTLLTIDKLLLAYGSYIELA